MKKNNENNLNEDVVFKIEEDNLQESLKDCKENKKDKYVIGEANREWFTNTAKTLPYEIINYPKDLGEVFILPDSSSRRSSKSKFMEEYELKYERLSCAVIFLKEDPNRFYLTNILCDLLNLNEDEYISIILDEEYNPYLIVATPESKDLLNIKQGSFYKLSKIFKSISYGREYKANIKLPCRFVTNKKLCDFLQEVLDMDYPDDIVFNASIISENNPIKSMLDRYNIKKCVSLNRIAIDSQKGNKNTKKYYEPNYDELFTAEPVQNSNESYHYYLKQQEKIYFYETIKNYIK